MRAVLILLALVSALLASSPARAGEAPPVLVELFTSQGCSACPPADALLAELADRDDVIALALHVDYWDYIGWKDGFARPEFTARQKAYARAAGHRTIYTPQMIVNGTEHVVGAKPMRLADALMRQRERAPLVALDLARAGSRLTITARPLAHALPAQMVVQLVRYLPSATVAISRGENAGRTITYRNIVTEWMHLARWDGRNAFQLELAVTGPEPVVVVIQSDGPGEVLAAARLR
ncbi:hypothetical protein SAMN05216257_11013 [Meinhardsimonia xiamenensis]|jgi:hypothetical protein|uniref:Secreted protein n=1 Tax=Meinhardsimonia xiamenensis TaxID=990712 RepID=A0A1G9H1F2_9RHOB|nr:DUF1223 domain-containing protein [Meinhardsimonia xiamenensis]PRX29752.1 hypothetical protein LV81_02860 [Meinhardsimonia xiamenensis]SDL06727.1 hypothetical protein SAMN05216257_11013 [Meinhardsimonia xiamenensis]